MLSTIYTSWDVAPRDLNISLHSSHSSVSSFWQTMTAYLCLLFRTIFTYLSSLKVSKFYTSTSGSFRMFWKILLLLVLQSMFAWLLHLCVVRSTGFDGYSIFYRFPLLQKNGNSVSRPRCFGTLQLFGTIPIYNIEDDVVEVTVSWLYWHLHFRCQCDKLLELKPISFISVTGSHI